MDIGQGGSLSYSLMFPTRVYSNDKQRELNAFLIGMPRLKSLRAILREVWESVGTNSTCNVRQKIICNAIQILHTMWDKYFLQCETNIFCNVRQMLFAVRDKYCAAAKICTLAKIAEVAKLTWSRKITILDEIRQRWKVKMLWLSHAPIRPYLFRITVTLHWSLVWITFFSDSAVSFIRFAWSV